MQTVSAIMCRRWWNMVALMIVRGCTPYNQDLLLTCHFETSYSGLICSGMGAKGRRQSFFVGWED